MARRSQCLLSRYDTTMAWQASVLEGAQVNNGCLIGAGVSLQTPVAEENTVYAPLNQARHMPGQVERHMSQINEQREILRKFLPQYHTLKGVPPAARRPQQAGAARPGITRPPGATPRSGAPAAPPAPPK